MNSLASPGMRRVTLATVGLAAVGLVVAMLIGTRTPAGTEITLHFTDTTGLYVGNDVQVIGVPVGTVTAIEPRGTSVEVTARLDDDAPIAADTGAVIMQSALVTDRFVELTTPWTSGPRLEAGATIDLDRTRSPVNVDDVVGAVDELVVALQDTADGSTVGDLLAVSADRLEGQGARIAGTIDAAAAALGTVDALGDDAVAVTGDLEVLVSMLAERDTAVQQLAASVADASTILAGQRQDLTATLTALQSLTATAGQIVADTQGLVVSDLDRATDVLATLADRTAEIGQTYDVLPLVAENLTRAYDPDLRRTRIRVDVRNTGPFSPVARTDLCVLLLTTDCDLLTNTSGTGILDPLLGWIPTTLPGDW